MAIEREQWEQMKPGRNAIIDGNKRRMAVLKDMGSNPHPKFVLQPHGGVPEDFMFVEDAGEGKPGIVNGAGENVPELNHPDTKIV